MEAQKTDPSLTTCRKRAPLPDSPFFYDQGLLMRTGRPSKRATPTDQIVLP